VTFFPLASGPTPNNANSTFKKNGSGALPFVFLKFQFYHSYY
jgi:hypothetical protein